MNLEETTHIGIISKRRPKNILKKIYSDIIPTWYVSDNEDLKSYIASGVGKDVTSYGITIGGKLVESRNKIIEDAKTFGKKYAVILEDDLTSLHIAANKKDKMVISISGAIELMVSRMENELRGRFKLAGVAPTANAFFYNPEEPISFTKFCIGSFMIIRTDCDLRFDNNLTLKEDYDYTLQHIQKYGGVVRCNDILANYQHYSNKGGVVGYRTTETEQQNINYLKKKWGQMIRDNPKRPNEILLQIPK
jgi:hypothetical protein